MSSPNQILNSSPTSSDKRIYEKLRKAKYNGKHNHPGTSTLDDAIDSACNDDKYQNIVRYLFTFQYFLSSLLMMGLSLLLVKPNFYCKQSVCTEEEYCEITNSEDHSTNLANGRSTMMSDFKLYCNRHYVIGLLGSLLFLGTYLAGFCFPYLANWKGRKIAIYLSVVLGGLGMVVIGVAPRVEIVIVLIVLVGLAFGGFEIIAIVYTSELSGDDFRTKSNTSFNVFWSVAQICTGFLFYFTKDWRVVCIAFIGAPLLLSLFVIRNYIYETPRFYYSKQCYTEAKEVLNKIAKMNRNPPITARLYGDQSGEGTFIFPKRDVPPEVQAITQGNFVGYLDLFRERKLRKITLFLLYIWFFRNFAYYGLNFSLPSLGTEVYRNFTIAAVAEIVANYAAEPINKRFGRKHSLIISVGLVSLSCLLIIFFSIPEGCYLAAEGCYQKTISIVSAIVSPFDIWGKILTFSTACKVWVSLFCQHIDNLYIRKLPN